MDIIVMEYEKKIIQAFIFDVFKLHEITSNIITT